MFSPLTLTAAQEGRHRDSLLQVRVQGHKKMKLTVSKATALPSATDQAFRSKAPSLLPPARDNGPEGELGGFQAEDLGLHIESNVRPSESYSKGHP